MMTAVETQPPRHFSKKGCKEQEKEELVKKNRVWRLATPGKISDHRCLTAGD